MKSELINKAILSLAGLTAMAIGTAILFFPTVFYASYGIDLGGNVSLLNELKAPGVALIASGLLIASGAFVARLVTLSALVAAFLYLSFGLSRLLSMAMDGVPAEGLVQATGIEILFGLACVVVLATANRSRQPTPDAWPG